MLRLVTIFFLSLLILFFSYSFVFAQTYQPSCSPNPTPNAQGNVILCNPVAGGQTGAPSGVDIRDFAIKLLYIFGSFTLVIPIMSVVYAGFVMIISQGNQEMVTRAKTALTWTIYGFIIALMAFVLTSAMIGFLGVKQLPNPNSPSSVGIQNPLVNPDFGAFLKTMLLNFLLVVGILTVLMLIINGFRYITSAGNDEQVTQAKSGLKWSIAGIIVVLLAYVIIRSLATFLGLP